MSRMVPLDDDVFEALQRLATPLVDDVNTVLRRLLSGDPNVQVAGTRETAKGALPDEAFEEPLLRALADLGGSGPTGLVIDRVGEILKGKLSKADWAPLTSSKEPRWRNRVQFARLGLVKTGHMVKGSPRGYWEITDAGRRRLEATETGGATVA